MRLLAFSDLHRDADAARAVVRASSEADAVVGAGDFATCGEGADETLGILEACAAPLILVHGNHDVPDEIAAYGSRRPERHYLHGHAVTVGGIVFFGLGGEIPARSAAAWNATETEDAAAALLGGCPSGAILVTHTPPFGSADVQADGTHEGSTAIRDAVRQRGPALHLCGHIHHAWGMSDRIGDTPVHNLGPGVHWFDV